jgi:hypothetical protein
MKELHAEWQALCQEHDTARDAHFKAWAVVTRKFGDIASNRSKDNPTTAELDESDLTWRQWLDVRRRMDEFVKQNV